MATISYPFTSKKIFDPETGDPIFDRAVDAEFMRDFYTIERTNGIVKKGNDDAYKVEATSPASMSVKVNAGYGFINGAYCKDPEDRTLELSTAHPTLNRIDSIVLRLDLTDDYRNIELYVLEGVASANPVAPELTRYQEKWELQLAEILVVASSSSISTNNITDTREDVSKCGISTTGADMDEILNRAWPVNSVMVRFDNLTPRQVLGIGIWEEKTGVVRGDSSGNLDVVGADTHTLLEAELAEHTHTLTCSFENNLGGDNYPHPDGAGLGKYRTTSAGQNAPHNNLPRSQNYRIYRRVS